MVESSVTGSFVVVFSTFCLGFAGGWREDVLFSVALVGCAGAGHMLYFLGLRGLLPSFLGTGMVGAASFCVVVVYGSVVSIGVSSGAWSCEAPRLGAFADCSAVA